MKPERFRWIAAVIYAHPSHRLIGRTRLQKEMRLLQRLGLPADYDFRMHYYGPYSDGIQSDINLLERMELVNEAIDHTQDDGRPYSIFTARDDAQMDEVDEFMAPIKRMADEDATVLELAATYDALREKCSDHDRALNALKRMKREKCDENRIKKAFQLLRDLQLPTAPPESTAA